jgi:hypothetical protein
MHTLNSLPRLCCPKALKTHLFPWARLGSAVPIGADTHTQTAQHAHNMYIFAERLPEKRWLGPPRPATSLFIINLIPLELTANCDFTLSVME